MVPTTMATGGALATTSPGDVESIMRKMADQQTVINELSLKLQTKSDDVVKLSEKQRGEMKHVFDSMIKNWVNSHEEVPIETREQFNNGILGLCNEADDNGASLLIP
jgi:hypothetical protein